MSKLRELLARAVELNASDIHMKPNQDPYFRVASRLVESGFAPLSREDLETIVKDILPPHLEESYHEEHEADFSYEEEGVGRFRTNVFMAQYAPSVVMRYVKTTVPSVAELGLPPIIEQLATAPRGVIIMSGTTGSGKSTTLAAMIQRINHTERRRIITLEDPVEYVFPDDQSLITQREIGLDTVSFHAALKRVMRQDPDIIMIGELRDHLSFMAGLAASETGHLVFTTLHSGTASQAVFRILDLFPSSERDQIRMAIATNLHAIVCQRLIPAVSGGVAPAVEVLINTPTVRKLLIKNQLDVLSAAIETGTEDGMQTFNQHIYQLIRSGTISEADGMENATNPEQLRMNLQGIFLDEGRRILSNI
ncbi:MAG: PilT/PilU family type 4a pilus ATPase [bacterium]